MYLNIILGTLDLSNFKSLKTVYSINSSKFDILTSPKTFTAALDELIKHVQPNRKAIHKFTKENVPFGYISAYWYALYAQSF